jgi:glutaredoxin
MTQPMATPTATSKACPERDHAGIGAHPASWVRGVSGRLARAGCVLLQCLTLAPLPMCNRKAKVEGQGPTGAPVIGDAPESNQLPPLQVRDDTADLLLTWVDEKGDFHVVQTPAEVPEAGRDQVRVVVTTKEEGTGRLVYVANLKAKGTDGSYPVETLTRAQWNEIGADRRKVRMEEFAKTAAPIPSSGSGPGESGGAEPTKDELKLNSKVQAVVYGAAWCKPCHDAEAYLKKLGVNVTKKDIEESRAARAEMEKKLAQAGRMGASIPVIDVGGQLFVGFSQGALRHAVESARKPETL